jgi:hypothetical protein
MTLKKHLSDIVKRLDSTYIAFGIYTLTRAADITTTILCFSKGKERVNEAGILSSLFMDNLGELEGGIIHELAGLALMISLYKFMPKRYDDLRNLVPYTFAAVSACCAINNMVLYYEL